MSQLGEFRRLSPEMLEELRPHSGLEAYDRVARLDDMLDLDRAWRWLAALADRAAFPVNPITAGVPFPDERRAWGNEVASRLLDPERVAAAAAHLANTPFEILETHLRPLLDFEAQAPVPGQPPNADAEVVRVDEEREQAIRNTLARSYDEMVSFFESAAKAGQCTIFWTE